MALALDLAIDTIEVKAQAAGERETRIVEDAVNLFERQAERAES